MINIISKIKLFIIKNWILILLFLFILLTIYFQIPFFKSDQSVVGWDTPAHLYTLEEQTNYLEKGEVFYWNNYWFNGYPALLFYPPLFFIILNTIYIITFKLISIYLLFKLMLLFLTILFVYSLFYFFNKFITFERDKSIFYAILTSCLWLFAPQILDQFGIGFACIFGLGEFTNFLGIILGLFLITYAKNFFLNNKKTLFSYLTFIVLYSLLLLSHIFSFFAFTIFLIFLFLKININLSKKQAIKNIISGFVVSISTIIISLFWLYPFLKYLRFSASQKYAIFFRNVDLMFVIKYLFSLDKIFFIILFIFAIIGIIYCLFKKQKLLVLYFLILFGFTYKFTYGLQLPLHYYRFAAYMYLFYIIFVVYALEFISNIQFKNIKLTNLNYIIGFVIICANLLFITNIANTNVSDGYLDSNYKFTLDNYDYFNSRTQLWSDLKDKNINNIFLEQTRGEYLNCISSPHILETDSGYKKIPSLLGLYTESSTSPNYYSVLTTGISDSPIWIVASPVKQLKSRLEVVFDKFNIFNVDYYLAYGDKLKHVLSLNKNVTQLQTYDFNCDNNFILYKINDTNRNLVEISKYKPFIYFESSHKDWTFFSRYWFESDSLYNYPVVRSNKRIQYIDLEDTLDIFSAIILPTDLKLNKKEFNIIKDLIDTKKLIFLESDYDTYIELHSRGKIIEDVFNYVNLININNANLQDINIDLENNNYSFNLETNKELPVIIRKSYFPLFVANNENTNLEVFEVTPNQMLIYTKGETNINFRYPKLFVILFLFFIVFLLIYLIYIVYLLNKV